LDGLVSDLAEDSGVRFPYNESVLLGVVLVLILLDKSSSGEVVGLSLSSSLVFDLESLEVSLALHNFDEAHVN